MARYNAPKDSYDTQPRLFVTKEKEGEGEVTLVSAVSGKSIVVLHCTVSSSAEGKVEFKGSSTLHKLTLAKAGAISEGGGEPIFAAAEGKALTAKNLSAITTFITLTYVVL